MTEPPEYPPEERREEAVTEVRRRPPGPPPWYREYWWVWGLVLLLFVALLIAFFVLRDDEAGGDGRTVPSVIGLTEEEAERVLEREGFEVQADEEESSAPAGEVFDQNPQAGNELEAGGTVNIDVSSGEPTTVTETETETETETATTTEESVGEIDEVPDIIGRDHVLAGLAVEVEGFVADTYPVPSSEPAGTVVEQSPEPGTRLREGETVRLNVSLGPDPPPEAEIPDVTGPEAGEARARCRDAGFTCRTVERDAPTDEEVGEVIDQRPAAGTTAPELTQITLFVGR